MLVEQKKNKKNKKFTWDSRRRRVLSVLLLPLSLLALALLPLLLLPATAAVSMLSW
jgi:hypothetical protein